MTQVSKIQPTEKVCETCKRVFKTEKDFLSETYQWRLCSSENLWFNCACGSTLMLPKGKFPWYSPANLLSEESQTIFNKIAKINELPHIPSAVMNIQRMLGDPTVETTLLAASIKKDPFLAAEILRVTENLRNLRNRQQQPMKSLEHAISYIGRKSIGDLVLAASIRSFELPTKIFDEESFWKHSFMTASIAEIICEKVGEGAEKDKVYLAGSLANIGKIIGAICYPVQMDDVQSYVNKVETMTFWEEAEAKFSMVSHCLLGEIGAAIWGLPKFVLEAARYHHTKIDKKKIANRLSIPAIVGLANLLSHWVNLEPSRIDNALLDYYKEIFSFDDKVLDQLVNQEIIPVLKKSGILGS